MRKGNEENEGMRETLAILADRELLASIERGLDEADARELLDDADVWDDESA